LRAQVSRLKNRDRQLLDDFHFEKENGLRSKEALQRGDLQAYGRLVHEHWQTKRQRSPGISTAEIDRWYQIGLRNGALGGKLLGAGGGGFLMFVAEDQARLRGVMHNEGLVEVRFRLVSHGTRVVAE
jgi:D-glycero-alpha-D-manno-heptose-7-phosphate kinase